MVIGCGLCDAGTEFIYVLELQEDTQNYSCVYLYRCTVHSVDYLLTHHQHMYIYKGNRKSVPLQAWSGPEGSRKLRFSDIVTTGQDGGKVSLTHRPPLPPGNAPGTHFC